MSEIIEAMKKREQYINRLRKLADLLEAKPDLILPYEVKKDAIRIYPSGAGETAKVAKLFPTSWTKNDPNKSDFDAAYYMLKGKWLGADVEVVEGREAVCKRVVTGYDYVDMPAVNAIAKHTIKKPIYEYECSPLLAKAVAS